MAPPARITELLPETLPEDFVEWDGAPSSAPPVQPGSAEPGPPVGTISDPPAQAIPARHVGDSSRNLTRGSQSVSAPGSTGRTGASRRSQTFSPASHSSRDIAEQLHAAAPAINELPLSAPNGAPPAATMTALHRLFPRFLRVNADEITKAAKKKWPIIAGASAALVLIFTAAVIPVLNRDSMSSAKSAVAPSSTLNPIQQPRETTPKVAFTPATAGKAQPSSASARRLVQKDAGPSREQALMMDSQLHTAARLRLKTNPAEQSSLPPGDFAAVDMDGSDNSHAIGAVLGNPKKPRVQMASQELITIPPAVALTMLTKKTPPVYPPMAKKGQVSGTIVLAATISETGKVDDLRVVSGPNMFRDSAINAVRAWRFKPLMLHSQPTAFETTINLHFSIN